MHQRRSERVHISVRVRVYPEPEKSSQYIYGGAHDLTIDGMAIYVPTSLDLGQKVGLSFELPYSRTQFGFMATIRNANGFRYGVEFESLTAAETEELRRVLNIVSLATGVAS